MMIWTMNNPDTIQKYLTTAFCEGVGLKENSGSSLGNFSAIGSRRREALNQTSNPIPASNMIMLKPVQMMASLVGTLPTNSSCGQLLVYDMLSFGRLVDAA